MDNQPITPPDDISGVDEHVVLDDLISVVDDDSHLTGVDDDPDIPPPHYHLSVGVYHDDVAYAS